MAVSIFTDEDNASFTSTQIANTVHLLEIATDTYDASYNDWITKLYCSIDCQCGEQPYLFIYFLEIKLLEVVSIRFHLVLILIITYKN